MTKVDTDWPILLAENKALRAENERLTRDVNIREIRMRQAETRQEAAELRVDGLSTENERLRAALTDIVAMSEPAGYGERSKAQIRDVARRALNV